MQTTHKQTEHSSTHESGRFLTTYKSDQVHTIWEQVRPLVARVCKRFPDYQPQDILEMLRNREAQLWVVVNGGIEGMFITKIENTPQRRFCLIFVCAGEGISGWIDYIKTVEEWAKQMNCDSLRIVGRKGWKKLLPDFNELHVTLERDIGDTSAGNGNGIIPNG